MFEHIKRKRERKNALDGHEYEEDVVRNTITPITQYLEVE